MPLRSHPLLRDHFPELRTDLPPQWVKPVVVVQVEYRKRTRRGFVTRRSRGCAPISYHAGWSSRRFHDCRSSRPLLPHHAPRRLPPCPGHPRLGPWNDGRIEYTDESFVDAILRPGTGDRKVHTPEELQAALAEHRGPAPSRMLWLHASLLEEARRLWAMMSAELTSPQSPGH